MHRVVKTSGDDEGMYVNDVFSGARTETSNFTAYINPYLVVSKGENYTKHIYIGSQRIVSKLGDQDSYGQDPRRLEYAGAGINNIKVDYKTKYTASQQQIKDNYENFEVPYYGTNNDDYVNGQGFCCDNVATTRSFDPSKNDSPELYQYYYHSDHLGSSSLITNLDGDVVQHVEYVPFGEVFIEERNSKWNTPYLFNSKELDEETGLYYYGARYYDPRTSVWISTDPLQEKYPNISTYTYCLLSPVRYIDPTGEGPWDDIVALGNRGVAWCDRNNVGTRALGGLKMVGGAVESFAGGTFAVVTSETVVGAVAGAAVFVHGSDVASAGLRQMLSGQDESSLTSQGLQAAGMSKQNAELLDVGISLAGTMGTSTLANSSKISVVTNATTKANFTVNPSKFDYFFGKVITGDPHNVARSAQNLKDLTTLGIKNESQLMKVFNQAMEKGTVVSTKTGQYGTNVMKSINVGSKGSIDVSFFYNGGDLTSTPSITTIIPKIFKQ